MRHLIALFFSLISVGLSATEKQPPETSLQLKSQQNHPSLDKNSWVSPQSMPHIFKLFPEFSDLRASQNKYIFTFADFERHFRYHQRRIVMLMLELKKKFPHRYGQLSEEEIVAVGLNHDRAKIDKKRVKSLYDDYLQVQIAKVREYSRGAPARSYYLLAFETLVEELSINEVLRQNFPTDSNYSYFARAGSYSGFLNIVNSGSKEYFKLPIEKRSVSEDQVHAFMEQVHREGATHYTKDFFSVSYLKNFTIGERLFVYFGAPYNELPLLLKWNLHNLIHFLNYADNYFTLEVLKSLNLATGNKFETAKFSDKASLLLEMELIADKVDRGMDPVAASDEFRRVMQPASRYLLNTAFKNKALYLETHYEDIVKGFTYEDYIYTAPLETCVKILTGRAYQTLSLPPDESK